MFDLKPHPEGGYYRETYRALEKISKSALPARFAGDCNFSTAIYYLLAQGEKSKLHRLKTDEIFHFYLGDPLIVVQIFSDRVEKIRLGQDILAGEKVQHVVPAGCWFGGYSAEESRFSFVGCTVAPGFSSCTRRNPENALTSGQLPL
ncbi:MAG: cupin domain-containing protein [Deltaproteobacteria bacterium]|nr:cupin domain-containing protein [Deltaproteobacteria bacterium]